MLNDFTLSNAVRLGLQLVTNKDISLNLTKTHKKDSIYVTRPVTISFCEHNLK